MHLQAFNFGTLVKDLIVQMLKENPEERIELDEVSCHSWMVNNAQNKVKSPN